MTMIFHIVSQAAWKQAEQDREYRATSLEREGFIHFSTAEQVVRVANAFYAGQTDLLLLLVDPDKVSAEVRYEPPAEMPDSGERFPHLYGALNLDAVTRVVALPPDDDGKWSGLPASAVASES
ncbi:MAG: DUF952 domain-containing protein [Chloroflexota bacterium]